MRLASGARERFISMKNFVENKDSPPFEGGVARSAGVVVQATDYMNSEDYDYWR